MENIPFQLLKIGIVELEGYWALAKIARTIQEHLSGENIKIDILKDLKTANEYDIVYFLPWCIFAALQRKNQIKAKTCLLLTHFIGNEGLLSMQDASSKANAIMCLCHSVFESIHHSNKYESPIPSWFTFPEKKKIIKLLAPCNEHARKGINLLLELAQEPDLEIIVTKGQYSEQELINLYRECDFVVVPSEVEGGPFALSEAILMGKPVICTPTGEFHRYAHFNSVKIVDQPNFVHYIKSLIQKRKEELYAVHANGELFLKSHRAMFLSFA